MINKFRVSISTKLNYEYRLCICYVCVICQITDDVKNVLCREPPRDGTTELVGNMHNQLLNFVNDRYTYIQVRTMHNGIVIY